MNECICAKEYHECKPGAVPWLVNIITDRTLRNASSYKESESGRITPKRSILKHLPDKKMLKEVNTVTQFDTKVIVS